jgi:hypothetical protein
MLLSTPAGRSTSLARQGESPFEVAAKGRRATGSGWSPGN